MLTEAQFVELYTSHFSRVKCFCARYNYEKSEDLAQEVFYAVWNKKDSFRGDSYPSTWAFSIALNVCRNDFRKSNHMEFVPIDDLDFSLHSTQYSHVLAEQVLDNLSPGQSVSLLHVVTGTTHNSQYERNLRYRARQKARSILA